MAKKKKLTSDRVMLEFRTEEQAKAFFNYFKEYGFDDFTQNDHVHDDLPSEEIPDCISSDEEPMENMGFYFIQIE
jgi:hypothetical protein